MRQRFNDIFCGLVLCLFVNFVFSNTVFMHTHHDADGRIVTHSHPFIPTGATHTHSGNALDTIASFNLGVTSMKASDGISVSRCFTWSKVLIFYVNESSFEALIFRFNRRGPPIAA